MAVLHIDLLFLLQCLSMHIFPINGNKIGGLEEFLSLNELKNVIFKDDFKQIPTEKVDRTGKFFGVMKRLKFGEENYIFIGARNHLHRISLKDLTLTQINMSSSQDLSKSISWNCFPEETHEYSYKYREKNTTINLTYDTCLSYYERVMAMNMTASTTCSSNNQCCKGNHFHERKIPGNIRYNNGWIRFHKELEAFTCGSVFIRGIEKFNFEDKEVLWVCGTFGSFPKAFLMDPESLEVIDETYDVNMPSCARWPDEPVATRFANNRLFVASGWGIYQPASELTDDPYNNSTMLYSDWRMLWNGLHWPTRMATVLGSDVRFLPRTYETTNYIYFFGSEVNPHYSYTNTMTRQAYSSFMIRVCKNDTGANYTAQADGDEIRKKRDYLKMMWKFWTTLDPMKPIDETAFSYSSNAWGDTYHLPTKIFTSAIKFPFGCYLKRYDGAQSLNAFWGQQNILYFNRVADLLFSFNWTTELYMMEDLPKDFFERSFIRKYTTYSKFYSNGRMYDPTFNIYNSMIAAFSSNGLPNNDQSARSQASQPGGAVCQFQVSEWKMDHLLKERKPSPPDIIFRMNKAQWDSMKFDPNVMMDPMKVNFPKNMRQYMPIDEEAGHQIKATPNKAIPVTYLSQREEFLALYSSFKTNFFSRGSVWLQGMNPPHRPGIDFMSVPKFNKSHLSLLKDASNCGHCLNHTQLKYLEDNPVEFEKIMNFSSTAWPTDWFSHLTKYYDAFFHMNPMSVAGDNASFVMDNVEFSKIFVLKQNFTYYDLAKNYSGAPLTYIILISTVGDVFRVVMCDLVSASIRVTKCEIRNTDQPYVTAGRQTMRANNNGEKKPEFEKVRQIRVSSLLSTWRMTEEEDRGAWEKMNPQSPILKDALFNSSEQNLILLTSSRVMRISLTPEVICASYRTCVGCASDPLCYWEFTLEAKKQLPLLDGQCRVIGGKMIVSERVSDVFGRGEKCQRFIPKQLEFIPKVMCLEENSTTDGMRMVSLSCLYKPLFRGFVKWQKGTTESNMNDIDFEDDSEGLHEEGPNQSLILTDPHDSMLYQCIGTNFDNEATTSVLARFKVIVANNVGAHPQNSDNQVIQSCFCKLWKKCIDEKIIKKEEGSETECEKLMTEYKCAPDVHTTASTANLRLSTLSSTTQNPPSDEQSSTLRQSEAAAGG